FYYEEGKFIRKNLKKAFYWYQKSAKNENDIAQYKLGYFYEKSIEIKEDLKKALFWYQKSAVNKNKEAQYNIIKCYINGIGINKDLEKAYKWHQRLVKNENRSKRSFGKYETNHQNINENIITDFGISKIGNNSTRHIGLCGKTAYIDPQILINHNFQYIKPSDIYSFGILMWEISSGYPPFKDLNDTTIYAAIINNNALIHENNAKITDFGISKVENNSTIHIGHFGKAAYIEPQILADQNFEYIKASDIYSFGILMWEISSGHPPFENKFNNNQDLINAITCHET
ncbi:11324_t:CDS:2, partial [Funneliformis geosporum]